MEKNNIALSDVERNKELFEYEMTEVILQLKGEFAKVSGKDLQLDEAQFVTPTMDIPSEIPNVTVQSIALDTVGVSASVSGDAFVIPEVTTTNTEIDCPAVSAPVVAMPPMVEVTKPELDCTSVGKIKEYSDKEVALELPLIAASVPRISNSQFSSDITLPEMNVQSVNTAIKIPKPGTSAQVETVRLDIPDARIEIHDTVENVVTLKSHRVNVSSIIVEIGEVHSSMQYSPSTVEVKPNISGTVIVPEISEYITKAVSLKKFDIKSPKVPKMCAHEDIFVSLAQTSEKVEKVRIPTLDTLPDEEVNITVKKPTIKFDYPTAAIVQIPTINVKATAKLSVPDMPDFSSEIQDIIDSAV